MLCKRAGKAWTYPPTYFMHMELDRANVMRVTADINVLKSKQARARASSGMPALPALGCCHESVPCCPDAHAQ